MNNMFKFDKEKSKKIATGVARGVVSVTLPAYLAYKLSTLNSAYGLYIFVESFAALLGVLGTVNYAFKVSKEDKNKTIPSVKVTNMVESEPCTETVGMENAKQYFKIVNR